MEQPRPAIRAVSKGTEMSRKSEDCVSSPVLRSLFVVRLFPPSAQTCSLPQEDGDDSAAGAAHSTRTTHRLADKHDAPDASVHFLGNPLPPCLRLANRLARVSPINSS